MKGALFFFFAALFTAHAAFAQAVADSSDDDSLPDDSLQFISPFDSHVAIGIAFGLGAISGQDVVELINQEIGTGTVSSYSLGGAAGFSGSITGRVLDFYDEAVSYAFLTKAYSFNDPLAGTTNYSYDLNLFSLYVHRVFLEDEFSLAIGVGGGLVYGVFRKSYSENASEERGTVQGWSAGAELVFRSVISGNFFLHTEFRATATVTPAVRDAFGNPFIIQTSTPPHDLRLNTFGGSVSVGLDYCF